MDGKTYVPELDGLRAIAVLLVIGFHADAPFAWGGFVGVDVFFVLSGYLITSILNREIAATGKLNLSRFYFRRLRRLTPPLLILVGCFLAVGGSGASALRAMLYLNDISFPVIDSLHQTWSLAVEEHYYLVWPWVLAGLFRIAPRHALSGCLALCALAIAWQFAGIQLEGAAETYQRLDVRLGGLLLGSALALFVSDGRRVPRSEVWGFCGCLVSAELLPFNSWDSNVGLSLGMALAQGTTALVILSIVQGVGAFGFLAATPLRFLGRISYGMYLFHVPLTLWMTDHGIAWWVILIVAMPVTIVLAGLSYFLVERPLQNWASPAPPVAA